MTHTEKMTVAKLLVALSQQEQAETVVEKEAALTAMREAIKSTLRLVRGYETTWYRIEM